MPAELLLPRLDLPVHLGVTAEERAAAQTVRVAIELAFMNPPEATTTDRLADTVDYASLSARLRATAAGQPFHLIERLAAVLLAEAVAATSARPVTVRLTVTKFPPVDGLTGGASFTLDRSDLETSR